MTRLLFSLLPGHSVGLKSLLISLPLLVVLPLSVFSAWLLYLMAEQSRNATLVDLQTANRALTLVVERELTQAQQLLQLLTDSPALQEGQVDRERIASLVQGLHGGDWGMRAIALINRQGHQVMLADGTTAQHASADLAPFLEQVFVTGRPVISPHLHPRLLDGKPALSVNLPVIREGRVLWVVSAELDPHRLAWLLSQQIGGQPGAMSTILDDQHNIIARTREMDRYFATQPSPQTREAVKKGPTGTQRFFTRDGQDLLWAWETLPAGWTVWLGIPGRSVDEALRDSMLRLGAAGLVALALGAGVMAWVARRIMRSVDTMTENVPRLARGEIPGYRPSGIRQLDALYEALDTTSRRLAGALHERTQALEAERLARLAADKDNRLKDVFLATLAHELRNPLAPVRSAAQLLRLPQADAASRRWSVEVIERQVGTLARLLDDLLDISRISSGRIRLERRRVSLSEVIDSAVEQARPLIDSRSHVLALKLPAETVVLDADPLRLSQIFANLLTNAAKYTDPGGRIELAASVGKGEVTVSVRDNGIGIEPSAIGSLFQMFSQVQSPLDRSQGGLGIGLALVRGLVELHGGRVTASSEGLGRGSEFLVHLPVAEVCPPTPAKPQAPAAVVGAGNRSLRVMVVDDNADAAESLALLLELQGHETRVAHGGAQALQLAEDFRPDVAYVDIGMPDLNGHEVARRLRAASWGQGMKLAALTGWGTAEDKCRALEAGFDVHLTKPVDPEELMRSVQEWARVE